MKEPQALNSVAEFHRTFKHPILTEPAIPEEKRCNLRVELLQEELNELKEAIKDKDIVEIADALADLQYVLSGAILEFGLGDKFGALFNEVQRSNMSKACDTMEDAQATVDHYGRQGTAAYIKQSDGHYLVYRQSDNKTLKSINYSPADLGKIISN